MLERKFTKIGGQMVTGPKVEMLDVHYVHPSEPYIPRSLSLRVSPVQVITRQMKSRSVLESYVVSPSIKSCMIFIRQNAQHVCISVVSVHLTHIHTQISIVGGHLTWTDMLYETFLEMR